MTAIAVAIFAGGEVELIDGARMEAQAASDSEYDEIRPDLAAPYLKWNKVNIELEHHDAQALAGVRRLRTQWSEMFASRLNPKRYKANQDDEALIETISEVLITEDKYWPIPAEIRDLGERPGIVHRRRNDNQHYEQQQQQHAGKYASSRQAHHQATPRDHQHHQHRGGRGGRARGYRGGGGHYRGRGGGYNHGGNHNHATFYNTGQQQQQ